MTKVFAARCIGLAAAALLLTLTGSIPFHSRQAAWTFAEEYAGGRAPSYPKIVVQEGVRTSEGLRVGEDRPGVLEWRFAAPGPLPTVVQPDWMPDPKYPARLVLVIPSSPTPRFFVLSENLPLRYRAIDFTSRAGGAPAFALRFEGRRALLKGMKLSQPVDRPPSIWPFVVVLILLGFFLPGGWDSRIVLLLAGAGFLLRWFEFANYFSVPLAGDGQDYWFLTQNFQWSHPFQTGSREPLFIWVLKAGLALFGDSERTLRFMTVLFSCGCIALICRLPGLFSWPPWVGWVAGAMYAFNPFAIFMSVQGYQLEMYTFLILALVGVWQLNKPLAMG
ncbi:MAG: hypothetical protein A2992_08525 [Elusimicrobia bacterium RIFCSPLOWO2_01_FULL_59_12]|nr:MAG: hypothetical protein A2992_08525 [Elusimicrobia bacterium RIFCSPLOWO2_01_FULL_59_12]